ncbi:WD repeat-containing protein 88 [Rhineura floridana]|uniref:WD repeat-containing protein 88 n=1 Tax=Rhineura floridana TaxID=261503 RepID=UPI002AC85D85|nr:WD repeat-containing protein 88 [Rhineura floridana]
MIEEKMRYSVLSQIHFKILKGHSAAVTSCHFCFDDTKILSASYDSTVKLWDIAHSISIQTFMGEHTGPISECCLSPDNKRLITASYDKSLKAWDTETGKVLACSWEPALPCRLLCASPDGADAHLGRHLPSREWMLRSFPRAPPPPAPHHLDCAVCLVSKMISEWVSRQASLGRSFHKNVFWTLEQDGLVTSCHISHDGKYVASGSDMENALFICNTEDAKKVAYIREYHKSTVKRCRFDPRNQRIATVSSDKSIKFWDIKAQSATVTIERAHSNAISDCRFSLDGHYLCTAGWDEVIKLWDIRTGEFRSHGPIILDQGHIGIVGCCDISKDASLVVSGGYDKTIIIWDSQEAYKKLSLKGHTDWVTDIAISSDKKWLVSSSKDCTLRVWDIEKANDIPVVIQAIKTRGSKIAKCDECKKSFLIFQNDEDKVETKCVFCRLAIHDQTVLPVPPPLPPDF